MASIDLDTIYFMKLVHFSHSERNLDFSEKYKEIINQISLKPLGLWVSVESPKNAYGWKEWCIDNDFRTERLQFSYEVKLHDNHNILFINTDEQLREFDKKHKPLDLKIPEFAITSSIDWKRVREKYKGIIITPYLYGMRLGLDCGWYYGWDCASGCIWDLSCIKSFELQR